MALSASVNAMMVFFLVASTIASVTLVFMSTKNIQSQLGGKISRLGWSQRASPESAFKTMQAKFQPARVGTVTLASVHTEGCMEIKMEDLSVSPIRVHNNVCTSLRQRDYFWTGKHTKTLLRTCDAIFYDKSFSQSETFWKHYNKTGRWAIAVGNPLIGDSSLMIGNASAQTNTVPGTTFLLPHRTAHAPHWLEEIAQLCNFLSKWQHMLDRQLAPVQTIVVQQYFPVATKTLERARSTERLDHRMITQILQNYSWNEQFSGAITLYRILTKNDCKT